MNKVSLLELQAIVSGQQTSTDIWTARLTDVWEGSLTPLAAADIDCLRNSVDKSFNKFNTFRPGTFTEMMTLTTYVYSMKTITDSWGLKDIFCRVNYLRGSSGQWTIRRPNSDNMSKEECMSWLFLLQGHLPDTLKDDLKYSFVCFKGVV